MISFGLQPFNKEHVVVFSMSWVAALSKLTYLKYNLPERFEISVLVKSSTLHFFFKLQPGIFLTSVPSTGNDSFTQF